MRLKLSQRKPAHHSELCAAATWSPAGELITCSDDRTVARWNLDGEVVGKVLDLDTYVTSIHWLPAPGAVASEVFALSCTDGTVRVIGKAGREEKRIAAAEEGAIISLAWNYDGSALVTGGEDGSVKVWSRAGMCRGTIAALPRAIYLVGWGPDDNQILFGSGRELHIRTLAVDAARRKGLHWVAHEGVVMQADWNPQNNLIISCGEDARYKVWDALGRQLYSSKPMEHVVTSIAWAPSGRMFAVGSFELLQLCDRTGWVASRAKADCGSVLSISWTADSTQLAGAGGNGAVVFGHVVERKLEWKNLQVTLVEGNAIRVFDVLNESEEPLDFRDRVVEMSLGYDHLIVATATQFFVYNVQSWSTPIIVDLRHRVKLILQSERHFALLNTAQGIQVYSYEGRAVSNPSFPGMRPEFLSRESVSLAPDAVAVLDHMNPKVVHVFNADNGRPLGKPIVHNDEIVELALCQYGSSDPDRLLVLLDRSRDLYLTSLRKRKLHKLHTMVDTFCWNDVSNVLVALADLKLVVWSYPRILFVDKDLVPHTKEVREATEFGKMPSITSFFDSTVTVRRADGAVVAASTSPYPPLLYEFMTAGRWGEAVRLCRFVQDGCLWACLAGMGLLGRHLDTVEVALAEIKEVEKLNYVLYIQDIPSEEGRNAELALMMRRPDDAEKILLQASPPLVFRAIMMNISLFRWERALDLAITHRTHVDTVLGHRGKFLAKFGKEETDARFAQYAEEVPIDWDAIRSKAEAAIAEEEERAGGGGGGSAGMHK
eukprot:PLAT5593.1.p1 GENE.PLAT5593.1~~PLAT5593.1.p1  ORF type:complete len:772 (-),score=389.49 PLAT5593.1:1637-3952(-)